MELIVSQEGSRARFQVIGNIDERGAEDLKRRFRELNISDVTEVIFDFQKVTHIGSAGIGKLLLFYKDLAVTGGGIKIVNTTETVYELLTVLKLDTIFTITRGT